MELCEFTRYSELLPFNKMLSRRGGRKRLQDKMGQSFEVNSQYHAPDFLNLMLFSCSLFDTLNFVIHYFQLVNIYASFRPSYSPSIDLVKLKYSVYKKSLACRLNV